MSLFHVFNEKHGQDWDLIVELGAIRTTPPGFQTLKAIGLSVAHGTAFSRFRNSVDQELVVASGVKQILESVQSGKWDPARIKNIPEYEEIEDEIDAALLRATVNAATVRYSVVEATGRDLVRQLEDPLFLAEFNNQGNTDARVTPYYTPLDQLYFLNLLAVHLPDSQAGIDYLKRSTVTPWGPFSTNMPLFHTDRFLDAFPLPANIGELSTSYLDPATGQPVATTIARLKAGADAVLGSYIAYRSYIAAGLVQQVEKLDVAEALMLRNLYASWERLLPDLVLVGGSPKNLREGYDNILRFHAEAPDRIRSVTPYAAASALAIVSVVGLYLAVKAYKSDPNIFKLIDATKEVTNIVASVAETLAYATSLSAARRTQHLVFARVATVFTIVTASIDVLVNVQETIDNIYGDPDQVLASSLKLAGAGLSLGGAVYTMMLGAVAITPIGAALVIGGLLAGLVGTLLTRDDTYIEKFLKFTVVGNRNDQDSNDPQDVQYQFSMVSRQISAYLNMIYGCVLDVYRHTTTEGQIVHTLFFDLKSAISLAVGATVYIRKPGRSDSFPETLAFRIKGLGNRERRGLVDIVQTAPNFFEHWARNTEEDEFTLNRIVYHIAILDTDLFDAHFEAEITMPDEGAMTVQRAVVSNATGIPVRFVPYYLPLSLYSVAKVQHVT